MKKVAISVGIIVYAILIGMLMAAIIEVPEAKMNPYIAGSFSATTTAASDSCGCAGTYKFCWTGEYASDVDKACINSDASQYDGTVTDITLSEPYGTDSSVGAFWTDPDDNVIWSCSADECYDDAAGTLYFDIYIAESDQTDQIMEVYSSTYNSGNKLFVYFSSAANEVRFLAKQNAGADQYIYTGNGTVPDTTWVRVGYSWSVAEDAHSVNINGGSWTDDTGDTIVAWAAGSQPERIVIGESYGGSTTTDNIYLDNLIILAGYKTADPL